MTKTIAITAVAVTALLGGCATSVPEAKKEAEVRWADARAQVVCDVARQHVKTGQLNEAGLKAAEALALDPTLTDARVVLGKVYIEKGRYAHAVAELSRAVEDQPQSTEINYLLGVALEKDGQLTEALDRYKLAYALDTRAAAPILAAAETMVALGRLDEAAGYLQDHAADLRNEPGLAELAGRVAMMQERYDRAAVFFQDAVDLAPRNRLYLESLARALFHSGLHERALEPLGKLAELAEKDQTDPPAWVLTLTGDCLMAVGRTHEARDAYRDATRVKPDAPGVWVNLAKAALALKDPTRAVLSARQALYLSPRDPDAQMLLGYALLAAGELAEAVSVLTPAVRQHPRNAMLLCVLGRVHAARGSDDQARRYYRQALEVEPQNVLARRLLDAGPSTQ